MKRVNQSYDNPEVPIVDAQEFLSLIRKKYINHNLRPGEAVVKAMMDVNPEFVLFTKGSDQDPTYNDNQNLILKYIEAALDQKWPGKYLKWKELIYTGYFQPGLKKQRMEFIKVILHDDKKSASFKVGNQTLSYPIQDVVIGYPGNIQLLANIEDGSHEIMSKHIGEEINAMVILPNNKLRLYPITPEKDLI